MAKPLERASSGPDRVIGFPPERIQRRRRVIAHQYEGLGVDFIGYSEEQRLRRVIEAFDEFKNPNLQACWVGMAENLVTLVGAGRGPGEALSFDVAIRTTLSNQPENVKRAALDAVQRVVKEATCPGQSDPRETPR